MVRRNRKARHRNTLVLLGRSPASDGDRAGHEAREQRVAGLF